MAAFGGTGGFGTHAVVDAALVDAAARRTSRSTTPPRSSSPTATTHHALVDRGAAEERRDAARPRRGRRRRHGGDPDRQGPRRARHRRGVERREVRALPLDRRRRDDQLREREHSRRAEAADRRQGRRTSSTTRSAAISPSRCSARSPGAAATSSSASRRAASRRCRSTSRCSRARRSSACSGASSRAASRKRNAAALAELARWYAEGKVKPVIDRRLPMRELPAAYERMGSRHGARQARDDQRLTRRAARREGGNSARWAALGRRTAATRRPRRRLAFRRSPAWQRSMTTEPLRLDEAGASLFPPRQHDERVGASLREAHARARSGARPARCDAHRRRHGDELALAVDAAGGGRRGALRACIGRCAGVARLPIDVEHLSARRPARRAIAVGMQRATEPSLPADMPA